MIEVISFLHGSLLILFIVTYSIWSSMALPIINSPTPLATISQEITFHVKHEILAKKKSAKCFSGIEHMKY